LNARGEILVLGATGTTGRRVVSALRGAGQRVRAASRGGTVRFDWADPDSWRAAVTGADRLYLMAPDGVEVDPAFVDLAVSTGVHHVVLLSSGAVQEMGDQRLLAAERTVRESGARWTILHPSWFDQNFDEGFLHPAVQAGEVLMPVGDLRQAFVDADDIAAVAAAVLTGQGSNGHSHDEQTYELRGPQALSFAEAVAIIGRESGRSVTFSGSPQRYLQAQAEFGRPREEASGEVQAFAALQARGDDEPNDVIQRVTGRPPKTFEAYAVEAAGMGAWRD